MRKLLFSLLALATLCGGVCAQFSVLPGFPPGVFQDRGALDATPAGYSGPGDVVTGAVAWYGLRAYNAASLGNAAVNVCNSTGGVDVLCQDFLTNATTGALVIATIGGVSCGVAPCTIKIWYDQSGFLNCSSAACNITQATIADRYTLVLNCLGTLPCAQGAGAETGSSASITTGFGQPGTTSLVWN